jgi:hypothetical protein
MRDRLLFNGVREKGSPCRGRGSMYCKSGLSRGTSVLVDSTLSTLLEEGCGARVKTVQSTPTGGSIIPRSERARPQKIRHHSRERLNGTDLKNDPSPPISSSRDPKEPRQKVLTNLCIKLGCIISEILHEQQRCETWCGSIGRWSGWMDDSHRLMHFMECHDDNLLR